MEKEDILKMVGETVAQSSKPVVFKIKPKNRLHRYFMKKGLMKSELIFDIQQITVGNRWRFSSKAIKLPKDTFENGKLNLLKAWEAVHNHTDDFLYIAAVCIQNDDREPSKSLIKNLRRLPEGKFLELLELSLNKSGVINFMKSIVLIIGESVLNVQDLDVIPVKDQE